MKWIIVGFKHPNKSKSIVYKQMITKDTLLKTIEKGIEDGCNLFSIRGVNENEIDGQRKI